MSDPLAHCEWKNTFLLLYKDWSGLYSKATILAACQIGRGAEWGYKTPECDAGFTSKFFVAEMLDGLILPACLMVYGCMIWLNGYG